MARDRQGWLKDTLRVSAMPALQLGPDPVANRKHAKCQLFKTRNGG